MKPLQVFLVRNSGPWGLRLLAILAACLPNLGNAAEPEKQPDLQLPAFHRIFLPPDEIDRRNWKQRYLPVDAAEFEGALQTIADGAAGAPGVKQARLTSASYTAQLIGDDLLVGTARFEIAGDLSAPALLSLQPCSLAIEAATWSDANKPAVLGTDPLGRFQVLVDGQGLDCRWSIRGQRTASGAVRFPLELPACAVSTLELTSPSGAEVHADQAVVTALPEAGSSSRWRIDIGGNNHLPLKIVPREASGKGRPLTLLRQSTTYEFTSRGINVGAQLRLDVHGEPLARLMLDLDPGLHLIGAKYGDAEVPWSATTDLESGQTHILLEFAESLSGTGRVVQLSAVAPLVTQQRVALPRMRPQAVAWQEGTANLIVPSLLTLDELLTMGCRQSRVTALPAPLAGESIEVQFFEPNGHIDLRVSQPRERMAIARGAHFEIGSSEITCREVLDGTLPETGPKVIRFPVHPGWVIDAVEGTTAGSTIAWEIDEGADLHDELQIELPGSQRVVVRGHLALPPAELIEADKLRMLDLSRCDVTASLVSVSASEGLELQVKAAELLEPRELASLTAAEQGLFAASLTSPVYADDERFARAGILVQRRKASFSTDLHVDVVAQHRTLTETFTILCTPAAARVDRLLVRFSQPREEPLDWSLAGGNSSGQFSARKLTVGEQAATGLRPGGEVWELSLQISRPGPFELRGQRTLPFNDVTELSLGSVSEAATQRGTLSIRALGDLGLEINNRGLLSVPAELLDDERYQTARAAYHFQPSGDDLDADIGVSIVPAPPAQASTGAWVWSMKLVSRLAADGIAAHDVRLELQTAGRQQLAVELPSDAILHAASIDQSPLSITAPPAADHPLQIRLPSGQSRATLRLSYSTPIELPGLAGRVLAPFPRPDLPVLDRSWELWTPPDYDLSDVSGGRTEDQTLSPTWSQRLFSILSRRSGQHVFNPLIGSDWRSVFASSTESDTARAAAEKFLSTVGNLAQAADADEAMTWGQLLSSAKDALGNRPLLIDGRNLAALEITPLTAVAAVKGDKSLERGAALFGQSGLVLAVTPAGNSLVTTSAALSGMPGLRLRYEGSLALPVPTSLIAEKMDEAVSTTSSQTLHPVEIWRQLDEPSLDRVDQSAAFASVSSGWKRYEVHCGREQAGSVVLVQHWRVRSLAWAVLLATMGLCLTRPFGELWRIVALIAATAAAALIVPAAYAPLAGAALLGGLLGLSTNLLRSSLTTRTAPTVTPRRRSSSSIVQATTTALFFAAFVHGGAALDAAPAGSSSDSKAAPPLYSVLVPIDEESGQPVGQKLYVPDILYEQLLRQAAKLGGRPQQWITLRGFYQGTVARDPMTSLPRMGKLRARLDIQVFQSNVSVLLPLPRDVWGPIIENARLDGQPWPHGWTADGRSLDLGPLATGIHRLELEVQPAAVTEPRRAGIDLAIPPLAQSTLSLTVPPDLTAIEVPSARGRVTMDAGRGALEAQLGSSDRLIVRWPAGENAESAAPNLEVEELVWIKVRPGTTVLDARFKFRVLSGRVRALRLITDPRLRLLTSPPPGSAIAAVHTIPGEPQRIELELAEAASGEVSVDLSFLVSDASGVGNLRLPRLEAADAKPSRRWLGVTVDPALQFRVQAGEDSRSLDNAEFLSAWGTTDNKPLRAYGIPRGEPIWFLATQPAEPQVQVSQVTAVGLRRQAADIRWDATLEISSGVLVQLGLQGPAGFEVERVSVREQDVERVARWSVGEGGRISVFLRTPLEGQHQISVRGRWRFEAEAVDLPNFKLIGATTSRSQWEIYRQPSVAVSIRPPAGAKPFELPVASRRSGLGSFAGSYLLDAENASIRVEVAPNNPQLSGTVATLLEHDDDQWLAELRLHINVTRGLVDNLQFEVPPQWTENFRVEPPGAIRVITLPGQQRRQLTFTPATPLTGPQTVVLRGRVAASPGDRLSAPDIVPLGIDGLQRFVVLPKTLESQQVTWDTLRLSTSKLPSELMPKNWNAANAAVFAVTGERFQASLKSVRRDRASANLRLADIGLAWLPEGGYTAAATLDIEPGGALDCLLELPAGCELIHATVERLPASLHAAGPQRYRLTLGPAQLPQRIELLYANPQARLESVQEYQPPQLSDFQVSRTLWTIYLPPGFTSVSRDISLRAGATDQQLLRLANTVQLVDLPSELLAEHLPEEIARWYDAWQARYATARTALHRDLIIAGRHVSQSEEGIEARALDRKMTAASQRMTATRASHSAAGERGIAARLAATYPSTASVNYFQVPAGPGTLTVLHTSQATPQTWPRWLGAAAFLGLAILVAWAMRGRTFTAPHPWIVLASASAFWWLFLAPSFPGLVVLTGVLLGTLWNAWTSSQQSPAV